MYIFTSQNIFWAGIFCEVGGILLMAFGYMLKFCERSNFPQCNCVETVLFYLKRKINNRNITQQATIVIVLSFLFAKFGKEIENSTLKYGLFCVDNAITVLICLVLVLAFALRLKIGLIFKNKTEDDQEAEISNDKLVASIGFVLVFSGIILQVFGV